MRRSKRAELVLLLLLLFVLATAVGILAARAFQKRNEPIAAEPEMEDASVLPEAESPEPMDEITATQVVSQDDCGHPAYENGICVVCGHACEHPIHDAEGHCMICGAALPHHYVGGVCSCGRRPDFRQTLLPDRFYEPTEHEGLILPWSYQTTEWTTSTPVTENVCFYLPYDYDPEQPYNVLVLMHGLRATELSWFTTDWELEDGRQVQLRWIYDRMIDEKLIEPLIIVSVSQYLIHGETFYKSKYEQMAYELQNVILPYTAENFSTYAEDCDAASLIAAREHFALGGNSWGSYYTYDTGMCQSLPYFSRFLCFSGDANTGYVVGELESARLRDYPIDLYYSAAGDTDVALKGEESCFYAIVPLVERLHDGENAFFHICRGGHDWSTWSIEIYNALQLLF